MLLRTTNMGEFMENVKYKNINETFRYHIGRGKLSMNESDTYYVGNYMYMGTWDGCDWFKHIITLKYIGLCEA